MSAISTPTRSQPALHRLMPAWDCREQHERLIAAPPEAVYAAVRGLTPGETRLFAPLMAIRALPARLTGRSRSLAPSMPLVELFLSLGFTLLEERPGSELVLGAIGRFWRPAGNLPVAGIDGREAFLGFDEPGYAKAALDFRLVPDGAGTRLVTETRVAGTDARATRLFRAYWLVIRLGSGAIRHDLLAAVARRCER